MSDERPATDATFNLRLAAVSYPLAELTKAATEFCAAIDSLNDAYKAVTTSIVTEAAKAPKKASFVTLSDVVQLQSSDGQMENVVRGFDSTSSLADLPEPEDLCPGTVLIPVVPERATSQSGINVTEPDSRASVIPDPETGPTVRSEKTAKSLSRFGSWAVSTKTSITTDRSSRSKSQKSESPVVRNSTRFGSWAVNTTLNTKPSQSTIKSGFSKITMRRVSDSGEIVGQIRLRNVWCDVDTDLLSCATYSCKWEVVKTRSHGSRISRHSRASRRDESAQKGDSRKLCTIAHPGGFNRLVWNGLCLALITWDILIMPMQAFSNLESPFLTCLEWVSTIIWTGDMVFNFRTGFFAGTKLEMRPKVIARHYCTTWFALDLALVFTEWVGRFTSVIAPASLLRTSRILRTMRFIKLVRLAKMQNLWVHVKEQINSNTFHLIFNMTLMTFALMICVHIIACIWFALGERELDGWTSYERYEGHKGVGFWYLASTRWVLAQVNGRTDDDDRRNMLERGYACIVAVTMAVIAKALFTSVITKTMLDLSQLTSEKTRRRRLVNAYLEAHQLSSTLVTSVKRHLHEYQDPDSASNREAQVLAILPRHLKAVLLFEVRGPRLREHPLFSQTSCSNVRQICQTVVVLLTPVPYEVVFDEMDACSRMLFIDRGSFTYGNLLQGCKGELISIGAAAKDDPLENGAWKSKTTLAPGEWISEPALWIEWNSCGRLVSDQYTCLYAVPANELALSLKDDSTEYARTVLYARCFTEELAQLRKWSDVISFGIGMVSHTLTRLDLRVTIESATGLLAADNALLGGKADPYCICRVLRNEDPMNKVEFKTSVVCNSLEPVWNETGNLSYSIVDSPLLFEVWDKDQLSEDDFLGQGTLEAWQFQEAGFDGEIRLTGPYAEGILKVSIDVESKEQLTRTRSSASEGFPNIVRQLTTEN